MASIRAALKNVAAAPPKWSDFKKKRRAASSSSSKPSEAESAVASGPYSFPSQYPAHVFFHGFLVIASFAMLPRTIPLDPPPEQLRNLDRPQYAFIAPLTARPEVTAAWVALGNAMLVGWWAGSIREWVREGKMGLKIAERLRDETHRKDIWNAALFTLYSGVAYALVCVLCGAPLVTHLPHTLLLGLNLAILTVHVPAYALGPPRLPFKLPFVGSKEDRRDSNSTLLLNNTWVRLFAERDARSPKERAIAYPAFGALTGAWVGVIPIGLDWDRPWQAYPLTPLLGATFGYVFGAFFAVIVNITLFLAAYDVEDSNPTPPINWAADKDNSAEGKKKGGKKVSFKQE
ncbi:PIG-F-domain-containing protein [Peniophora sp. CONT]|nr:PIG-F-domain-containing protein [Peniophora sp. CONT]